FADNHEGWRIVIHKLKLGLALFGEGIELSLVLRLKAIHIRLRRDRLCLRKVRLGSCTKRIFWRGSSRSQRVRIWIRMIHAAEGCGRARRGRSVDLRWFSARQCRSSVGVLFRQR